MNRTKRIKRAMRRLRRAWRRAGFDGLHYVPQDRTLWDAYQDAIDVHGIDSPEAQQARAAHWEADAVYIDRCHDMRRLRNAIEHTSVQMAYAQADDEGRWYMAHDY